jgi:mRNA interferase RelE/StbE
VPGAYRVEVLPRAGRDLRQLDQPVRKVILGVLRALGTDPRPPGVVPIKGHRPYLRVRSGDYRVIYAVDDDTRVVTVARVRHRREVYRGLDL